MKDETKGFGFVFLGLAVIISGSGEFGSFIIQSVLSLFNFNTTGNLNSQDWKIRITFLFIGLLISLIGVFFMKKTQHH